MSFPFLVGIFWLDSQTCFHQDCYLIHFFTIKQWEMGHMINLFMLFFLFFLCVIRVTFSEVENRQFRDWNGHLLPLKNNFVILYQSLRYFAFFSKQKQENIVITTTLEPLCLHFGYNKYLQFFFYYFMIKLYYALDVLRCLFFSPFSFKARALGSWLSTRGHVDVVWCNG